MKNKIGIGIIGTPKEYNNFKDYTYFVEPIEKCLTWTKNKLLYQLLNDDCDHIFLMDDTVEILDVCIFANYIDAAKKSGIWYLMYRGDYKVKNSIDYDGVGISFSDTINKQFCYYYKGIIKNVGFFDERYSTGLLEQIDYTYRVIQKGICPPWGWFADYENSNQFIKQLKKPGLLDLNQQNYWNENQWFKYKHKEFYNKLSDTNHEIVIKKLEELKEQYGKNI